MKMKKLLATIVSLCMVASTSAAALAVSASAEADEPGSADDTAVSVFSAEAARSDSSSEVAYSPDPYNGETRYKIGIDELNKYESITVDYKNDNVNSAYAVIGIDAANSVWYFQPRQALQFCEWVDRAESSVTKTVDQIINSIVNGVTSDGTAWDASWNLSHILLAPWNDPELIKITGTLKAVSGGDDVTPPSGEDDEPGSGDEPGNDTPDEPGNDTPNTPEDVTPVPPAPSAPSVPSAPSAPPAPAVSDTAPAATPVEAAPVIAVSDSDVKASTRPNVVFDTSENGTVSKDVISTLASNKNAKSITVRTGSVRIKIEKDNISDKDAVSDIDFTRSSAPVISDKQIEENKQLKDSKDIVQLNFRPNALKGIEKITLTAKTAARYSGRTVTIYELVDGVLIKVGTAKVKGDGSIAFDTNHLGQFVISIK